MYTDRAAWESADSRYRINKVFGGRECAEQATNLIERLNCATTLSIKHSLCACVSRLESQVSPASNYHIFTCQFSRVLFNVHQTIKH